jgi:hypothetical protein
MCAERVRRRVMLTDGGPVVVHGPIEVVLPDGRMVRSDRAVSALCTLPPQPSLPVYDTRHRWRVRQERRC